MNNQILKSRSCMAAGSNIEVTVICDDLDKKEIEFLAIREIYRLVALKIRSLNGNRVSDRPTKEDKELLTRIQTEKVWEVRVKDLLSVSDKRAMSEHKRAATAAAAEYLAGRMSDEDLLAEMARLRAEHTK